MCLVRVTMYQNLCEVVLFDDHYFTQKLEYIVHRFYHTKSLMMGCMWVKVGTLFRLYPIVKVWRSKDGTSKQSVIVVTHFPLVNSIPVKSGIRTHFDTFHFSVKNYCHWGKIKLLLVVEIVIH